MIVIWKFIVDFQQGDEIRDRYEEQCHFVVCFEVQNAIDRLESYQIKLKVRISTCHFVTGVKGVLITILAAQVTCLIRIKTQIR